MLLLYRSAQLQELLSPSLQFSCMEWLGAYVLLSNVDRKPLTLHSLRHLSIRSRPTVCPIVWTATILVPCFAPYNVTTPARVCDQQASQL